jgi:hypothetical protein
MALNLIDPEGSKFLEEIFSKKTKLKTDKDGRIIIEVSGDYVPPKEKGKDGPIIYK